MKEKKRHKIINIKIAGSTEKVYLLIRMSRFAMVRASAGPNPRSKSKKQSNPHKTTILETTQKWPSRTGGRLIKHLYKTTTNKISSFLADFLVLFPR